MSTNRLPLILVPGLLCTETLWQAQVEGLADVADVLVTTEHTRHTNLGAIAAA
ncbi:MAG: alpha/beta hydrolase, partial [Rhodospirillaceae bacterium]|nr:alpha/beta hydrolase [Rhodospirillaceae bacterium]